MMRACIVRFSDEVFVGPFPDEAAADRYLSDFPAFAQDGVVVEWLRTPKEYPAPTRGDLRDVP